MLWEVGWSWPGHCPQLSSCLLPTPLQKRKRKKRSPAETVHRAQDSPSRARPQSPAAGSGAGGVAGAGGPGHGAGRPPGELGAHSGSGAAAIWAASPRRRGRSRNGGASGGGMEGSARQPGTSGTQSPHRAGWWLCGASGASGVFTLRFPLLGHKRVPREFLWGGPMW